MREEGRRAGACSACRLDVLRPLANLKQRVPNGVRVAVPALLGGAAMAEEQNGLAGAAQ
jgi:hypothetical protein